MPGAIWWTAIALAAACYGNTALCLVAEGYAWSFVLTLFILKTEKEKV